MVVFIRTLVLGGARRGRSLSSERDGPLHTTDKTLCREVGEEELGGSCDHIVRRAGVERAMNPGHHLPLWAAAATQSQHMLPALFSGLIYAVELRWMTESSSVQPGSHWWIAIFPSEFSAR